MRFIQIPRKFLELKEGTKFIDVLVYAAIAFQTDKETSKSRISIKTIADKYNITLSKVEESIKRLKAINYLDYTQIKSETNDYVFNEYVLPKSRDFLMLKPELLTEDLKAKERGILIYLQLIAEIGINDIAETTIEGIASRIGVTRKTMSKHLKYFIDNNYITKGKHFYQCRYLAKEEINLESIII
jgi:DNA-binding MarR family transcriptional regulator